MSLARVWSSWTTKENSSLLPSTRACTMYTVLRPHRPARKHRPEVCHPPIRQPRRQSTSCYLHLPCSITLACRPPPPDWALYGSIPLAFISTVRVSSAKTTILPAMHDVLSLFVTWILSRTHTRSVYGNWNCSCAVWLRFEIWVPGRGPGETPHHTQNRLVHPRRSRPTLSSSRGSKIQEPPRMADAVVTQHAGQR